MLGSGTIGDPYIIQDVDDLQAMEDHLGAYYELGTDIDASITSTWNGGAGFVPIGRNAPFFTGHLDGKDYIISDLHISRNGTDGIGLFGGTFTGAVITNVHLIDVDIHGEDAVGALIGWVFGGEIISFCDATGSVIGREGVGGLFGYAVGGTIYDCHSDIIVTNDDAETNSNESGGFIGYAGGVDIDRCYATGSMTALGTKVGGFVGYFASGTIDKSYCTGAVIAGKDALNRSYAGGFVGFSNGTCTNCYSRSSITATGNYVGGFAGVASTETNCYSTGAVSGVGADIGGFCGVDDTETACFWDKDTSGQATDPSPGATGKTTAEMKDEKTFIDAGWAFGSIWSITDYCNDGYPCLLNITPCCSIRSDYFQEGVPLDISALEGIRNIEMSAMGRFYVDELGKARYESRYARNK